MTPRSNANDKSGLLQYVLEAMKRAQPYDRETALDAAMTLFWTKGYHATSLKDLEGALNMKPGSIYAAFSSKEALFSAALERYFQQTKEVFRSMHRDTDSPLGALADYLRSIARDADTDPDCQACMLIKTILNATTEDAAIAEQARHYLDQIRDEIATAFDRAIASGELPADIDTNHLARRYQANISALKIEAHRGTGRNELAALADEAAGDVERLRVRQ